MSKIPQVKKNACSIKSCVMLLLQKCANTHFTEKKDRDNYLGGKDRRKFYFLIFLFLYYWDFLHMFITSAIRKKLTKNKSLLCNWVTMLYSRKKNNVLGKLKKIK